MVIVSDVELANELVINDVIVVYVELTSPLVTLHKRVLRGGSDEAERLAGLTMEPMPVHNEIARLQNKPAPAPC